jgi:6-phosphogluconolactonase
VSSLGRFYPGKRWSLPGLVAAVAVALVALPGAAAAKKPSHKGKAARPVGQMYTETNGAPNKVLIFNRFANGKLALAGSVATGGTGGHQPQPGCTPPGGCPFLDTQNEVVTAAGGKLVFAVNAGSNTVTAFKATGSRLKKVSVASSKGAFPNSLTVHGDWLYVLNSNSDNLTGYKFNAAGHLTPIAGSTQALVGGALPGLPRQIGFDNTGKVLMVSLLANMAGPPPAGGTADTINTFRVNAAGVAGAGTAHNATGNFPFAFAFDTHNQSIMAQVNALTPTPGTAQRYTAGGTPIGAGVTTKQFAPCWVASTTNGKHVYIVNTGGGAPGGATVAEYNISSSGALTLIGTTPALPEFLKTDEALSADDHYLYVVAPLEAVPGSGTTPGPTSHIDEYKVLPSGKLKLIGKTATIQAPGLSGLAGT